ncbi:MAG TPA: phenylalanine--tRNA ligase subunit beta [Nitriliruptorales bacterium]|nr:phenylalanine--tRNA ligase subunit beta [Nitriliruptorales bacterium]
MKVPLSWLHEFVAVELPLDELVELMGRGGLEVEEVRRPGAGVTGVVVARVQEVRDHPDADRLVVVTVEDGDGERVVCAGARNLAVGDLVPLAVPGATLPGTGGTSITIERRDMRGVVSDGMLCSPRELQVADDHGGIMVLGDAAAPPGTDIHELLALGEPVIDVAIPADRGDLQSILGIARDLAAILDVDLEKAPDDPSPRDDGPVQVRVEAADGCAHYVGWAVQGLTVADSPWWLRRRLEACGVRSLSNLVDVTNYVMLEQGQPLHAFDTARLRGHEVAVRWGRDGERLTTLDGRQRVLAPDDLVIADADRAVALAGVMGGEDTEVGPATSDVLLEAAVFDATAVRRTSRRLGLVSEASVRFERGVDPSGTWRAAGRAVELLVELAGGTDAGARADGAGATAHAPIELDTGWAARFLGLPELSTDQQTELLRRSGTEVEVRDGGVVVATPPSWRGDLGRPADLAEEVARLHGYEGIPATLPAVSLQGGLTARQRAEREVRQAVRAAGFHEAHTYPFVGSDAFSLVAADDPGRVTLENPLQKDAATLRPSLAEGLLGVARRNVGQGRAGLALAELGRVFRPAGGTLARLAGAGATWSTRDGDPLPAQPMTLGLLAYGSRSGPGWRTPASSWGVFDLLAVLDEVAARLAPDSDDPTWRLERVATERPGLHPGRTAALRWRGIDVGVVGQLHPAEAEARDLPETTVLAEMVLEPLWEHLRAGPSPPRAARPIARHPAVAVDVAVVAPDDISYAAVEAAVREGAGDLLDGLWWFDEFRGEQLGEGRRSLAFHLRLQAPDRQLTDRDAEAVIGGVEESVERIGATLRR